MPLGVPFRREVIGRRWGGGSGWTRVSIGRRWLSLVPPAISPHYTSGEGGMYNFGGGMVGGRG